MRTLLAWAVGAMPLCVPGVALAQDSGEGMVDSYGGMVGGMASYGSFVGPALLILVVVVGLAVWAVRQKSR